MFSQSFPDPPILTLVCSDHQYEIAPGCIVGVEEICHKPEEAEAASEKDKLIFLSELLKKFLLIFLGVLVLRLVGPWRRVTRGSDSFTGC
jgi:hypothetical protein